MMRKHIKILMAVFAATIWLAVSSLPAAAQSSDEGLVVSGSGAPACAASANGTGHMICVFVNSGTNQLAAVSVLVDDGSFPASPLNPANSSATPNPLPLGVSGTVGNSSCSSTVDTTGDIVCAYVSTSGELMGIRFNIFGIVSPSVGTPLSLGIAVASGANASCTTGAARFTFPANPKNPPPPIDTEGTTGDTICGVRNSSGTLVGVAFQPEFTSNPSPSSPLVQSLNVSATTDPSCNNALDGTNQVICVYNNGSSLEAVRFDPRTNVTPKVQNLVSASSASDAPACAAPLDNSGDVLCINGDANGTLIGFAANPEQGGSVSPLSLTSLDDSSSFFVGVPSCAGTTGTKNQVVCVFGIELQIDSRNNSFEIQSVQFDPRTTGEATLGGADSNRPTPSCTFENANGGQIACATNDELGMSGEIFE